MILLLKYFRMLLHTPYPHSSRSPVIQPLPVCQFVIRSHILRGLMSMEFMLKPPPRGRRSRLEFTLCLSASPLVEVTRDDTF